MLHKICIDDPFSLFNTCTIVGLIESNVSSECIYFQGKQLFIFCFCLPFECESILKEKICSPMSKFFSSRDDPFLERCKLSSSAANRKSHKLFPFVAMAENSSAVPYSFSLRFCQTLSKFIFKLHCKLPNFFVFLSVPGLNKPVSTWHLKARASQALV